MTPNSFKHNFVGPLVAVAIAVVMAVLILMALGENPYILWEAFIHTFFTSFGLGYTLFYTTPLILTGLSVALCFHAGLFNIGSEGQLYLGAAGVIATSLLFPRLPSFLAIPLGIIFAMLAGAAWGAIAGVLKAKRGSHEVIVTILLNFIGITFVNYLILYPFKNTEVQNPETWPIGNNYFLIPLSQFFAHLGIDLFKTTPVNVTLFISLLAAVVCYLFLFFSSWGYEIRAVGQNPKAARVNGISNVNITILVFMLSGALAGLVGVNEVMGFQHKLIEGFSPQYGFTGIAVALMARNHPLGIIITAFLFGAVHNSSREIEFLSDKVTKEIALVLEAILILFIAGQYYFLSLWDRFRKRDSHV